MRGNPYISRKKEREALSSYWRYSYLKTDVTDILEADISKQNRSWGARGYYIATLHVCRQCGKDFRFTAQEQKLWFEEYGFFIDAYPGCCLECRREKRKQKAIKHRYDAYQTEEDGKLSIDQCKELADLIMELFGPDLDEKKRNRYNHMMNRISREERE
ncbi:zinc-ribbon domain containing protein [Aeoliella mucimassa]|nr:zinc-ribbon domain containing protein [Aeoliella mucimassa]